MNHTPFSPSYQEYPDEYRSGSLICTKVAGVTFNNRQAVVARLHAGELIQLRREPDNLYDRNAIRVERLDGQQIGYLDRSMAARLAPFFDAHSKPVRGKVHSLTGSGQNGYNLGVIITFNVPRGGEL